MQTSYALSHTHLTERFADLPRVWQAAGVVYLLFAGVAFYFYGTCAADTLTLNLMESSAVLGRVATVGVLTSTFTIIPVQGVLLLRIMAGWFPTAKKSEGACTCSLPCAWAF